MVTAGLVMVGYIQLGELFGSSRWFYRELPHLWSYSPFHGWSQLSLIRKHLLQQKVRVRCHGRNLHKAANKKKTIYETAGFQVAPSNFETWPYVSSQLSSKNVTKWWNHPSPSRNSNFTKRAHDTRAYCFCHTGHKLLGCINNITINLAPGHLRGEAQKTKSKNLGVFFPQHFHEN